MYIDGSVVVLFLFVWISFLIFFISESLHSSSKLSKAKAIKEDNEKRLALLEQKEELVKKMNEESRAQMISAQKALIEAKKYKNNR